MENVYAAMRQLPSNGVTVTASLRELVKLTGDSRGSVQRTLGKMREVGWIEKVENRSGNPHNADSFRLLRVDQPEASPLWSAHGVGASARLVYESLPTGVWVRTGQAAENADVPKRTTRKQLRILHSVGLVDEWKPGSGWWMRFDDDAYRANFTADRTEFSMRQLRRRVREEQVEWHTSLPKRQ